MHVEFAEKINEDFDYLVQDIENWPVKEWLKVAIVSHIMRQGYFLRDVQFIVDQRFTKGE